MARVIKPSAFSRRGEAGAGARARPNRSVIGPSGKSQGVIPDCNSGKEVALSKSSKVGGVHVRDAALIHFSRCNDVLADQFAEPGRFLGIDFVVEVHSLSLSRHLDLFLRPLDHVRVADFSAIQTTLLSLPIKLEELSSLKLPSQSPLLIPSSPPPSGAGARKARGWRGRSALVSAIVISMPLQSLWRRFAGVLCRPSGAGLERFRP